MKNRRIYIIFAALAIILIFILPGAKAQKLPVSTIWIDDSDGETICHSVVKGSTGGLTSLKFLKEDGTNRLQRSANPSIEECYTPYFTDWHTVRLQQFVLIQYYPISNVIYNPCGDGTCSGSETCSNCPADCGPCCTPQDCSDLGKECDSWDNGCGGTVDCGTCSSGEQCTAGECKLNDGQACSADSECAGGYCVCNICRSSSADVCGDGCCGSGENCGNCVTDCAVANDSIDCYNNDEYQFDSCGGLGSFVQDCGTTIQGTSYCDSNENLVRDDILNSCSGGCISPSQTVLIETCQTDTLACSLGTNCACSSGKYECNDGNPKSCKDCSGGACQGCAAICTKSPQSSGDDPDEDGIDDECDAENTPADCNDGVSNDNDTLIDYDDPDCNVACTQCSECGDGFWNLCDVAECNGCAADCAYKSGIRLAFIEIGNDCCVDSDGDGICNVTDSCEGFPDNIDPDEDGNPNGCDLFPFDFDDDGSDDGKDCWDNDLSKTESDTCDLSTDSDVSWAYGNGITRNCGADRCESGIYFDYTDCNKTCNNNICNCECPIATQPHSGEDFDGDGYQNICDFNYTDPCSKESKGDNCNTLECPEASIDFCSVCSGAHSDADGVIDVCEEHDLEPCAIHNPEDNCGGQGCGVDSQNYCDNCPDNDGDGDGVIDICDTENSLSDCNDEIDNDGNGLIDYDDDSCETACTACEECGNHTWDFCEQAECEGCAADCSYRPGIGPLFSRCCVDTDNDMMCDIDEDICIGYDDNIDPDGDGTPQGCDTCDTEPLITTELLEPSELSCNDGIDNDCDTLSDVEDVDCQCPGDTARCVDGTCSNACVDYPPCNSDGVCDQTESCNCGDCHTLQASCVEGYACNPNSALCSNEPDLNPDLCENSNSAVIQGACDPGESNCWAAYIPLDVIIIGDSRCCGDDADETWSYESTADIDDLLLHETCYEGEWRSLSGTSAFYNLGVE